MVIEGALEGGHELHDGAWGDIWRKVNVKRVGRL